MCTFSWRTEQTRVDIFLSKNENSNDNDKKKGKKRKMHENALSRKVKCFLRVTDLKANWTRSGAH